MTEYATPGSLIKIAGRVLYTNRGGVCDEYFTTAMYVFGVSDALVIANISDPRRYSGVDIFIYVYSLNVFGWIWEKTCQ